MQEYKDGCSTRQITKMLENDFKLNGYDLIHSIGHGVGLEIHEPPYISSRSDTLLKRKYGSYRRTRNLYTRKIWNKNRRYSTNYKI